MSAQYTPQQFEIALWKKVDKTASCWMWTASITSTGYGQVRKDGKPRPAHRVVYELIKGRIPDGLDLDHLCRTPLCVNPDHLEPVTARINILRGTGPTAINAKKTHCPMGHIFDSANTYMKQGRWGLQRKCRKCAVLSEQRRIAKLRAGLSASTAANH